MNTKAEDESVGETCNGNLWGRYTRNGRGDEAVIEFAERNNLGLTDTILSKLSNTEGT